MVDESLLSFFYINTSIDKNKLKALISIDQEDDELYPLSDEDKIEVLNSLDKLTIIDPACGS
jgi:hypothetical protein